MPPRRSGMHYYASAGQPTYLQQNSEDSAHHTASDKKLSRHQKISNLKEKILQQSRMTSFLQGRCAKSSHRPGKRKTVIFKNISVENEVKELPFQYIGLIDAFPLHIKSYGSKGFKQIAHWEEQRHKSKFVGFQERQF